ncbi:MAG: YihY/virulence factor BrkB family protein [Methylovirgula sp.]
MQIHELDRQEARWRGPRLLAALILSLLAVAFARSRQTRADETLREGHELSITPPPWDIGWRGWRHVVVDVYNKLSEHRILAVAGGVTFYSLLAIFPAIAAVVSLYGLFADPDIAVTQSSNLSGVMPGGAISIIQDQMTRVASQQHGTLGVTFAISLAVSLWSANAGIKALFDALNVVKGEEEKRSFLKLNAIALAFTSGAILFVLLAMSAIVVLPVALKFVGVTHAPETFFRTLMTALRWPGLFAVTTLGFALIYRYGPCCRVPRWRWISWGSAFAALAWLAASFLFSWYTGHFGSYNETYGALGAVIGFMTWIWISSIVILLGAEFDAAIARAAHVQPSRPKKET